QVLEERRGAFLARGEAGLQKRGGDPLGSDRGRHRAKLGETATRLEQAELVLGNRGSVDDRKKDGRPEDAEAPRRASARRGPRPARSGGWHARRSGKCPPGGGPSRPSRTSCSSRRSGPCWRTAPSTRRGTGR